MEDSEPIHIPKNRNGGVFIDAKDVTFHSNDFEWDEKIESLSEAERNLVKAYILLCTEALQKCESTLHSTEERQPEQPASGDCGIIASNKKSSWEKHYTTNKNHFPIKNTIIHAFPLIRTFLGDTHEAPMILECGCGKGSTLLPILRECTNANAQFVGFDVSSSAISYFAKHEIAVPFTEQKRLHVFDYDIMCDIEPVQRERSDEPKIKKLKPETTSLAQKINIYAPSLEGRKYDVILLVFVLSALPSVESMIYALRQLGSVLKPGGFLFFRDYGFPDHNFFRFATKNEGKLPGLFFQKGDGTSQFFFQKEYTRQLLREAGFKEVEGHELCYHCNRRENRKNGKRMDKIFLNGTFTLM